MFKKSIKAIKNIFFYIIIFTLLANPVQAQTESTPSGEIITPISTTAPLADLSNQQSFSATIKLPPLLLPLPKKNYNTNENIELRIKNSQNQNYQINLKYNNQLDKFPINKSYGSDGNDLLVTIDPPRVFQPGKYELEVTNLTYFSQKQDFFWGNLAINTDKSVYIPNDQATIGISVVDGKGIPVCDAHLTLAIEFPESDSAIKILNLTTADKSISVNPAC